MSKKANPTLIGAFVVGAVALVITGVLVFGSGKFFSERRLFVLFFDGSIKGLSVGAPVKFRGVNIGSVSDIKLRFDRRDLSFEVPVFIEIKSDRFQIIEGKPVAEKIFRKIIERETMKSLIERGLKAQLQMESLLTGKLCIALDFHPDKPSKFVGIEKNYLEIPTIPSNIEELSRKVKRLEEMPIEDLVNSALRAIEGIDRVVNSSELSGSISSLYRTLDDLRKLIGNVDGEIAAIASSFRDTSKSAQVTLEQIEKTIANIENAAGKDSPFFYEVTKALEDLSKAARSIRAMADYLQRHPEALIRGKGGVGGK